MSQPDPPSPGDAIQAEALRMARSIQTPGQTKEQTKLIAQGIAKGIELYKKQQSAKARERDKLRKRLLKQKQVTPDSAVLEAEANPATDPDQRPALLAGGGVFGLMALAHLLRALLGWEMAIGPWAVPTWISGVAALALAGLSAWLFRTAQQSD